MKYYYLFFIYQDYSLVDIVYIVVIVNVYCS